MLLSTLYTIFTLLLFYTANSSTPDFSENIVARQQIPHLSPAPPLRQSLPRVSLTQLDQVPFQHYKLRKEPFILTDAMQDWGALQNWKQLSYLTNLFADQVSDYYPYNMLVSGGHPYLIRFGLGIHDLMEMPRFQDDKKQHAFTCPELGGCKYLHLQLTPESWSVLEERGDIPRKRHGHLEGDNWWMRRCLQDPRVREEFHLKTHWKILLIGSQGAGMFNHSDSLLSSSWHGHVLGQKWWYLCSPQHPGQCYESVLKPGEVLFYPAGWYHETRNLITPTLTVTGTVVYQENYEKLSGTLFSECSQSKMGFRFSAELCDALDVCFDVWYRRYGKGSSPLLPWRDAASPETVREKEAIKATDNNYDGRNHIIEK